jgi:hypothetical protein
VTDTIPVTVLAGGRTMQTQVSPAWLLEHYRTTILAAEGSYPDKIRRVQAGVTLAREEGTFTPAQCDRLEQMAAKALHATLHPEEKDDDDDEW